MEEKKIILPEGYEIIESGDNYIVRKKERQQATHMGRVL